MEKKISYICKVSDCYKFELNNCIQAISECNNTLKNYWKFNSLNIDVLSLEIEYSTFLLKYLNALLHTLESKKCNIKDILSLRGYLLNEFTRLKNKYKSSNCLNYFSEDDLSLLLRNIKFFIECKRMFETKMGLVYLRYLYFYLNKLKSELSVYETNNFIFINKFEIFKYSFRVFFL
jgi:hypothetical protein